VRKPLGLFAPLSIPTSVGYMTTCLGIRNATHWADTRSIERNFLFIMQTQHVTIFT